MFLVMAVNRDYRTHDSTLVLPVSRLGREYIAVSASSEVTQSQLAVAAYNDCTVQLQLPRQGILLLLFELDFYYIKCVLLRLYRCFFIVT